MGMIHGGDDTATQDTRVVELAAALLQATWALSMAARTLREDGEVEAATKRVNAAINTLRSFMS